MLKAMLKRAELAALAVLLALALAPPAAATAAEALVAEARFVDHCLGQPQEALAIYERLIREGATGRPLGEALYGRARALYLAGERGRAEAVLEQLVALRRDRDTYPWPKRGGKALDALIAGHDPYARPARGTGEYSLSTARRPMLDVLHELRRRARVCIALDPSIPEPWTVSVALRNMPFERMVERIVGPGMVRKLADGAYIIGDVASNEAVFERGFRYAELTAPADRQLASVLRTRRVNLTMPEVTLIKARGLLEQVIGAEVELGPGALASGARVRMWVEDQPLDVALDMLAISTGLRWRIEGGAVTLEVPLRREED